jgi:hypothetical protein
MSTIIYREVYNELEIKTLDTSIHEFINVKFPYNKYQHFTKNQYKNEILKLLETFLIHYPNYKLIKIITDKKREYTLSTIHLLFITNYFSNVEITFQRKLKH